MIEYAKRTHFFLCLLEELFCLMIDTIIDSLDHNMEDAELAAHVRLHSLFEYFFQALSYFSEVTAISR